MADWYCSSAAYAAIPAFVASTAYTVGQFVKPTAPAAQARWVFRCTTAGTAGTEPTWPSPNNSTVTTGGATFTHVTGQSAYGWAAAAGDVLTLNGAGTFGNTRFQGGDRLFLSSDHSETQTTSTVYYGWFAATSSYSVGQMLSVNRAGSVPPVAADLLAGASLGSTSTINFDSSFPLYFYGITFPATGGFVFGNNAYRAHYFDNCQLNVNSASAVTITSGSPTSLILNNSTLRFGAVGQQITTSTYPIEITWLNTPSAILGTVPTVLFLPSGGSNGVQTVTVRGVDLSAVTGTLVRSGPNVGSKYLFDSCRIASGVTRYNNAGVVNTRDLVELINCFDGTSILNESYQPAGSVVTERTITLSAGATDDIGTFSHKLVSNTNIDKYVNPLLSFWMDVENTAIGASHTATVEIISSLTLNNDDISLLLEYQGTSGSSVASFANTLPANVLTANAAVTASTATWNASPATPVKQKLVLTFTPLVAGSVRGLVRLGRASTTVYVDPVITIA